MNRELRILLGAVMNLGERLANDDAPRSIALAQRTFQRCRLDKEKIIECVKDTEREKEITWICDELIDLKKAQRLERDRFMNLYMLLLEL